jgi:L-alanine-DL-glutamate epimerase-like enolase superfamily enzyme
MQITHVETFRVTIPGANPPYSWRQGLLGSRPTGEGVVLRLGTDAGVEGVALVARPGSAEVLESLVDRVLRDELVGQDPLQREWIWHRIWEIDRIEELPLYLLGIVDVALWDLAGRQAGCPSWQVMGGFRTKIPAYASTTTFGSVEQFLDVADQCLALGYQAIKLHAFGDARKDAKLCTALREHVGDDIELMYDGSAGFDLPDAIYLGKSLAAAGYLWYEEPMAEFSISAYSALRKAVDVPLLVAETSDGVHMNTADFIAAGTATFGVRTSAKLRGGMTGALRIAHLADSFNVRAEVHSPEIPSRHLCMAISNTTYFESIISSDPVRRGPGVSPDGMLYAPTDPGIALPGNLDLPSELQPYAESETPDAAPTPELVIN